LASVFYGGGIVSGKFNNTALIPQSFGFFALVCRLILFLVITLAWAEANALPFNSVAPLTTARSAHTATLLSNGKVLVAGGGTSTGLAIGAELYDPALNSWVAAGTLLAARSNAVALLLPNGKVLVAGGQTLAGAYLNSAELYDPATNSWSVAGSMAVGRVAPTATLLQNGKVLVAGGYGQLGGGTGVVSSAELYDPATNSWSAAGILATARYVHTATLLASGKVLVTGGYNNLSGLTLSSAELYDPATNGWSTAGTMAAPRKNQTANLLPSGLVLVAGGGNLTASFSSAEIYNPTSNSWSSAGALANPRAGHSATLLPNGKVLVTGGIGSTSPSLTVVAGAELYDPSTNSWSAAGTLATPRFGQTATLLPSGKVLLAAGTGLSSAILSSAEICDPAVSALATTGSLGNPRYYHSATQLPNGKVLIAGGVNVGSLRDTELYDPATGSWSPAASMAGDRYAFPATLLNNGKVLVAGGASLTGGYLTGTEIYDPVLNTWSAAGPLSTGRENHTSTLLPSGKVLVVGGMTTSGFLNTAELYDPVTNSWSAAGTLASARYAHTATLLPSGKVLVAGGQSATNFALNTFELYDPAANTWSTTGTLANGRSSHTATLLPSGKVLLAGGASAAGVPLLTSELYDPGTNTSSAAGTLVNGRYSHTASLLLNGIVALAGGFDATNVSNGVDLYDPATNTWSVAGSLATARHGHTATLLPSGSVLFAGGYNGVTITYLNSAELYRDDLGFQTAWQPVLATYPTNIAPLTKLALTGSVFNGVSEASGGNGSQNSASNYPIVMLQRMDNEQQVWLGSDSGTPFTSTSMTTGPVSGVTPGPARLTMFVNGIPSASAYVIAGIVDTIPPVLTMFPPITAEATSPSGATVNVPVPSATDNASVPNVSCTPPSGLGIFPLGTTTVTCIAIDAAGNATSGTSTIRVLDTTPPTIHCPAAITSPLPIVLGFPVVSDLADPNPRVSNSAPSTFPLGTTIVLWSAVDASGNASSCSQLVTVIPSTAVQSGDVPLPPWAYVLLALGLMGAMWRYQKPN
jgi:N-acetylneuraminic acid mutarotase